MKKIKILISGAGPAGLAVALTLDPTHTDVTIIDRTSGYSTLGYSIILWKRGIDILKKFNARTSQPKLFPLDNFHIFGGDDMKKLVSINTKGFGASIKRNDLMQYLINSCSWLSELSKQY